MIRQLFKNFVVVFIVLLLSATGFTQDMMY